MIGNYRVAGNVEPADPFCLKIVADSEYNAYLDPSSFAKLISCLSSDIFICPLDCTNYAPLDRNSIEDIRLLASERLEKSKDVFINNLYYQFDKLLGSTLIGVNTEFYMWDLVVSCLFVKNFIGQKGIRRRFDVDWTGRLMKNRNKRVRKSFMFDYINYNMLVRAIVGDIFGSF